MTRVGHAHLAHGCHARAEVTSPSTSNRRQRRSDGGLSFLHDELTVEVGQPR